MTQKIIIRLQRNFMGCLWNLMVFLRGVSRGSTLANPMHTCVCYVMYCKPYAKQSPHKLSIWACKKMLWVCGIFWYFFVCMYYVWSCCCSWIQLFVYATHEFAVNFLLFFVEISFKNSFNPKLFLFCFSWFFFHFVFLFFFFVLCVA